MTQHQQLIGLFQQFGYRVTLGQILRTTLAAEYRARMTELRRAGWTIDCIKGKTASENEYRAAPPDQNGQLRMTL